MSDSTSDLTFRPTSGSRTRRNDDAWEAIVREELNKLRRRSPAAPRVVPASRRRGRPEEPAGSPPDAAA
ncbi:MAG: hypothetical protein QOD81_3579 [Solirubrobacteraceae bacterium]|jgi:hypothetical protein|nr:hypothetical protein [Solirubrobacteraceae bacterium]